MRHREIIRSAPERTLFGLTKLRIVEIGVALLLTLAALLFVGLTVWAAEMARIEVADAWARPTIGEGTASAAYMTIANKRRYRRPAQIGAHAEGQIGRAASDHDDRRRRDADAQNRRRHSDRGRASLVLKPDGTHLMLLGLEDALKAGEQLILTLEFANAGPVDVVVPVSANAPATTSANP